MEWINTLDKLPPMYEYVLTYNKRAGRNGQDVLRLVDRQGVCWEGRYTNLPTHWMPLPTKPA